MCNYYKFYYSCKINLKRRKLLAILSFTSGLMTFLIIHQGNGINPMDFQELEAALQPTNDTPTDLFIGELERNTEIPFEDKELLLSSEAEYKTMVFSKDADKSPITDITQTKNLNLDRIPGDIESKNQQDFQIHPTNNRSKNRTAITKRKTVFRTSKNRNSNSISHKTVKKQLSFSNDYKKTSNDPLKSFEKTKFNPSEIFNNLKGSNQDDRHKINIPEMKNIDKMYRNTKNLVLKIKQLEERAPKDMQNQATHISTSSSDTINELQVPIPKTQESEAKLNFRSQIHIPNPRISNNSSFVTRKNHVLDKILKEVDLPKLFSNTSYKSTFINGDLSQWNDFLTAPEDSPDHTFEPSFVETYDLQRVSKSPDEQSIQGQKLKPKTIDTFNKTKIYININDKSGYKNPTNDIEFPLSLRDIPKQTIRTHYEVTSQSILQTKTRGGQRSKSEASAKRSDSVYPLQLDYTRPAFFPWRSTNDECSHFATRFLKQGSGAVVPLVSFPGSGNTWLRYITEVTTGVFSGSLYEDDMLAYKGFWGERDHYLDGTTLLQKTHSIPQFQKDNPEWNGKMIIGEGPHKAVILIRSPYEAIVSLRHFHAAGHTGFGHHTAFKGRSWDTFTEDRALTWIDLNKAWIQLHNATVLVIHYEMLLQYLDNEVKRLFKFLGIPVDFNRLACLLRYPEGKFRRPRYPKHLQGYQISKKAASTIASGITILNQMLAKYGHPTLPTHLYSFHPATHSD